MRRLQVGFLNRVMLHQPPKPLLDQPRIIVHFWLASNFAGWHGHRTMRDEPG
jgi:hypothetical protein